MLKTLIYAEQTVRNTSNLKKSFDIFVFGSFSKFLRLKLSLFSYRILSEHKLIIHNGFIMNIIKQSLLILVSVRRLQTLKTFSVHFGREGIHSLMNWRYFTCDVQYLQSAADNKYLLGLCSDCQTDIIWEIS